MDKHASVAGGIRRKKKLQQAGGTTDLSGKGAQGCQQDEDFTEKGLFFECQAFQHPRYKKIGTEEFVPGLSTLDSLAQLGVPATRELLLGTSEP